LTFNYCLLLKVVKYASASECPIDEQNYPVSSKRGRETCLKSEDGKAIVDWVLNMASAGFPIIIIIIYSIFIAHFSIKTNVQRRSHSRLIQGN